MAYQPMGDESFFGLTPTGQYDPNNPINNQPAPTPPPGFQSYNAPQAIGGQQGGFMGMLMQLMQNPQFAQMFGGRQQSGPPGSGQSLMGIEPWQQAGGPNFGNGGQWGPQPQRAPQFNPSTSGPLGMNGNTQFAAPMQGGGMGHGTQSGMNVPPWLQQFNQGGGQGYGKPQNKPMQFDAGLGGGQGAGSPNSANLTTPYEQY